MTTTENPVTTLDTIDLEVLRSRLEAVAEQAAAAVDHTAISPTVTESKDYSVTLLDADGGLIIGTGIVQFHFGAATHAVCCGSACSACSLCMPCSGCRDFCR